VFDHDGHGVQAGPDGTTFDYPAACLVTGSLDGRSVPCLSIDRQIEAHTGFEPRDVDRADLALLRALAE
jgi:lincosamide nucleotidyltransferase A/C/D/E